MLKEKKEYIFNIYNVIFQRKINDVLKFFLISTPGSLAALFEGISFSFLLISLYVFNGRGLEIIADKPVINLIAKISFLHEMSNNHLFILFVLAAIVSQLFKSLIMYLASYKSAAINARLLAMIQKNIYEHILSFDFQTVSHYKAGDLANYAQLPSSSITIILTAFHKIFVQGFILIVLALFLFKISVLSTLTFLCFFIPSVLMYRKLILIISYYSTICATQAAEFTKNVVQSINGIKLIHIFGMQEIVLNKSNKILKKIEYFERRGAKFQNLLTTVAEFFSMIMIGITLLISSFFLIMSSNHSLPLLLTYLTIVYRFTTTIKEILIHVGTIASKNGNIKRLNNILTKEDKGFEKRDGLPAPSFKEKLSFDHLSFCYPTKKLEAIEDFSFEILKGKMTAIAGISGSGKSTLINLITRLYSPTGGKILVDGIDLQNYEITSWRNRLGVVSQNSVIFNDTARENICFGTYKDDDDVWEACRMAGCDTFMSNLPQGLDTPLGEHGYRISGGESQRIAIARALIRKPEILIFDEATSNLDSHNEKVILQTLQTIRKNSTLIVIAHRLSTIIDADNIIVLEHGKILEEGTHEALISKEGKYSYLWNLQSKKQTPQTEEVAQV